MMILLNDSELFFTLKLFSWLLSSLWRFHKRWQEPYWKPWHLLVLFYLSGISSLPQIGPSSYSLISPFHCLYGTWLLNSLGHLSIFNAFLHPSPQLFPVPRWEQGLSIFCCIQATLRVLALHCNLENICLRNKWVH